MAPVPRPPRPLARLCWRWPTVVCRCSGGGRRVRVPPRDACAGHPFGAARGCSLAPGCASDPRPVPSSGVALRPRRAACGRGGGGWCTGLRPEPARVPVSRPRERGVLGRGAAPCRRGRGWKLRVSRSLSHPRSGFPTVARASRGRSGGGVPPGTGLGPPRALSPPPSRSRGRRAVLGFPPTVAAAVAGRVLPRSRARGALALPSAARCPFAGGGGAAARALLRRLRGASRASVCPPGVPRWAGGRERGPASPRACGERRARWWWWWWCGWWCRWRLRTPPSLCPLPPRGPTPEPPAACGPLRVRSRCAPRVLPFCPATRPSRGDAPSSLVAHRAPTWLILPVAYACLKD